MELPEVFGGSFRKRGGTLSSSYQAPLARCSEGNRARPGPELNPHRLFKKTNNLTRPNPPIALQSISQDASLRKRGRSDIVTFFGKTRCVSGIPESPRLAPPTHSQYSRPAYFRLRGHLSLHRSDPARWYAQDQP